MEPRLLFLILACVAVGLFYLAGDAAFAAWL